MLKTSILISFGRNCEGKETK